MHFSPKHFQLPKRVQPVVAEYPLRLWNGDGLCCRRGTDPLWRALPFNASPRAYAAAYSRADLARVIEVYSGVKPSAVHLRTHWREAWGDPMAGAAHERGLWIEFDGAQAPVRVF